MGKKETWEGGQGDDSFHAWQLDNGTWMVITVASALLLLPQRSGPLFTVGSFLQTAAAAVPCRGRMRCAALAFPRPDRCNSGWPAQGFYGSHGGKSPGSPPCHECEWQVGLASAPKLAGPWTRLPWLNPASYIEQPEGIENPIVTRTTNRSIEHT